MELSSETKQDVEDLAWDKIQDHLPTSYFQELTKHKLVPKDVFYSLVVEMAEEFAGDFYGVVNNYFNTEGDWKSRIADVFRAAINEEIDDVVGQEQP